MASLSFPSVNSASLNSLTGTARVSLEQSPLRLGHWGWVSPEWCWNSPVQPKVRWLPRIHQDPGNDHKKSSEWFTPEPWPCYSRPQHKTVGPHWPWVMGGGEGSWECLKGSQISGQWQRRATQGWTRRVFANPSPQRNSPTFSFLLSPPTDCQQYLLIFCCLVTWSAYLSPHSHFLPGQRKRHFLVVGQSCWVNHSGRVRSRVTKLRRKKRTPRWNLNFR